jgi:[ribosomal protein S18]-alanine N-acetyltransferase
MTDHQTGLIIRPMVVADLDRVLAVAESMSDAPHWPRSAYLKALDPTATPRRIALVATDPTTAEISGFAIASQLSPQAELETIAVAADTRRRGLGRRLFGALVGELRRDGINQLDLEVRASNASAIAFYGSLGFVETGRRPRYYADPIEDAVLMHLQLG